MVWVSLEEAEPIPDISWSIRVLQPPPEQENTQYGEPGARDAFSKFPSTQHVIPFPASCITLWGFLGLSPRGFFLPLVGSHGEYSIWVPALGIRA